MMHDQFAAQLRRDLVENANERPADGQLETVLRRTAIEPQYRPWVARLRTRPELGARLGWQLRYGLAAVALLLAIAAATIWFVRLAFGPGHGLRRDLDLHGHCRRQHPDARRGSRPGARRALRGRLLDSIARTAASPRPCTSPMGTGGSRIAVSRWPFQPVAAGSPSPHSSGGTTTTPRPIPCSTTRASAGFE